MSLIPGKFRFGLRSLLALTLLVAIPFGLIAGFRHQTLTNFKAIKKLNLNDKAYEACFKGNSITTRFLNHILEHPQKLVSAELHWNNRTDYSKLSSLQNLKSLTFWDCRNIDLEMLPPNLEEIKFFKCRGTSGVDLCEAKKLINLEFYRCDLLTLRDLKFPSSLQRIKFSDCEYLVNVDGLKPNSNLQTVCLNDNYILQNVDGLSVLTSLRYLDLSGSENLKNIDGIRSAKGLNALSLHSCSDLKSLDDISDLSNLEILDLSVCKSLSNLNGLGQLPRLKRVCILGCSGITEKEILDLKSDSSLQFVNQILFWHFD